MAARFNNYNSSSSSKAQEDTNMDDVQEHIAVSEPPVQPAAGSSNNNANTSRRRDRRSYRVTKNSGSAKQQSSSTAFNGSKKRFLGSATAASRKPENDCRQTADRTRAESSDAAESHGSISECEEQNQDEHAVGGGGVGSQIGLANEIHQTESAYAADDEGSDVPTNNVLNHIHNNINHNNINHNNINHNNINHNNINHNNINHNNINHNNINHNNINNDAIALPTYGAHNIPRTKPPRYRVRIDSAGVERRELRILSSYKRADGKTMIRILSAEVAALILDLE